jgi:hypothetical protein
MQKQTSYNNELHAPKLLPEWQRFQRCEFNASSTDSEKGFLIGDYCTAINHICDGVPYEIAGGSIEKKRARALHPQRMSICQNWTFWNERRQSRYQSCRRIFISVCPGSDLVGSWSKYKSPIFFFFFFFFFSGRR